MRLLILSGNPKTDGLCQSVIDAAAAGARDGGAVVEEVRLCDMEIERCHVCEDGWGVCRNENYCIFGSDGFDDVAAQVLAADAVVLATPVYWHESSEAIKSFLDRFRRCYFGTNGPFSGKQVLLIASAGGTGNGILPCLQQLERFCLHTGAQVFDMIGINRWNSDYKREAARAAGKAIAAGRKNDETV
jgi:multimeric flavodoxin WrbA